METLRSPVKSSSLIYIGLCVLMLMNIPMTGAKLVDLDIYQDMLVDMHNSFRRKLSASNMKEMVWDSKLADKAGYWSKWCTYERHNHKHHSKNGENLFTGKGDDPQRVIFEAVQEWYDQGDDYRYQPFQHRCGDTCEYTQLVWAKTNRVGCAINLCGRLFNGYQTLKDVNLLVCFYEPRGNLEGEFPYDAGIPCANCPRGTSCREGLCADDDVSYESNLIPISVSDDDGDEEDDYGVDPDMLPRDPAWTENPAYQYAEAPPITHTRFMRQRDRRYPDDLRYRRAQEEERRRREQELRRQREEHERRRQQMYEERRRRQQAPSRHQQMYEERQRQEQAPRRHQQMYEERQRQQQAARRHQQLDRRPEYDYRRVPSGNSHRYSYTDVYNRYCSCECRRVPSAPSPTRNPHPPPGPGQGDLTQTERYELISVHNLMRDERKLPRIHWSAELEKWCNYIIRCGEHFPGPKHTHTNFGKMTMNEDVYAFVHAWGSEGSHLARNHRHCRGAHNDYNCNRHSILMKPEVRGFACTTTRCRTHRQIVCLYR